MFDVGVIGHIVRDINTIGGTEYEMRPGGAAYYSTMVYSRLGLRTAVVTKVASVDERALMRELRNAGVTIFNRPTAQTTTFRNFYAPDNADVRIQRVDAQADHLTVADMPPVRAKVWQVGPLTDQDVNPVLLAHCARAGGVVAMDVQGLTRRVVAGEVRANVPMKGSDYIRHVDIFKADEDEILVYTDCRTIAEAVAKVQSAGAREILVTRGSQGSTVFVGSERFEIEAVPPRQVIDATGCGDTYLAAYVMRRMTSSDFDECGRFASVVASLNIEQLGAFHSSVAEVAERQAATSIMDPLLSAAEAKHRGPSPGNQ